MFNFKNIIGAARKVTLRSQEKQALRAHLEAFMDEHTVMEQPHPGLTNRKAHALPLATYFNYRMPIALGLLLLLSGGTAFAAQGALPGDPLYPVKINVDENVQSMLAVTPLQKAAVASDHAAERVAEAEQLSAKGSLNANTSAQLNAVLSENLTTLQQNISALAAQDPKAAATIAQNLKVKLDGHKAMLVISGLGTSMTGTTTASTTAPSIQIILPVKVHLGESHGEATSTTASTTLNAHIDGKGRIHIDESGNNEDDESLLPNPGSVVGSITGSSTAHSVVGVGDDEGEGHATATASSTVKVHSRHADDDQGESDGGFHLDL